MATPREIEQWLQEGIAAAKAGQVEQARFRLLDVVEQQQTNEVAWYWLYQVFNNIDDKRICLENLIIINHNNQWAKQELLKYLETSAPDDVAPGKLDKSILKQTKKKTQRPVMLKLVSAFWVGISIIFLGSGIISAGEWLVVYPNSQNLPNNIATFQFFNLLIAISFIIVGLLGIFVAVTLFMRSMFGFYGSILLSLGLLLVGPTISLITDPPNYITLVCTAGISGMIVLLTLASQSGFENFSQNDNTSD